MLRDRTLKNLEDLYENSWNVIRTINQFERMKTVVDDHTRIDQKLTGTYYTPNHLTEFLVKKTISKSLIGKINIKLKTSLSNIEELLKTDNLELIDELENVLMGIKILDFSVGSGIFLVAALNYLMKIYRTIKNCKRISDRDHKNWNELEFRKRLMTHNIYGIDIDPDAVEICKLKLLLTLLDDYNPETNSSPANSDLLPDLDYNIFCGNSLIGFNSLGDNVSNSDIQKSFYKELSKIIDEYKAIVDNQTAEKKERIRSLIERYSHDLNSLYIDFLAYQGRKIEDSNIERYNPFHWILFFPKLLEEDEFDVIIGNPPYNAKISTEELVLIDELPPRGTFQSANLFVYKAIKLLREDGHFGLVLPKSICYTSNWKTTRELLIPRIEEIVDVRKAFTGVRLEQVLVIGNRVNSENSSILSYDMFSKDAIQLKPVNISRKLLSTTGKLILNLNQAEIDILVKVTSHEQFLGDLCTIQRGFPWQKQLSENEKVQILEGKNIKRNHIKRTFLKISDDWLQQQIADPKINSKLKRLSGKKILLQNIVAHITKPLSFIELCGVIDEDSHLTLDTVDNLFIVKEPPQDVNCHSVTAYLNSTFASWFAYRFIYTKAIRTMHFDNVQLDRLPFRYVSNGTVDKDTNTAIESLTIEDLGTEDLTDIVSRFLVTFSRFEENRRIPLLLLLIATLGKILGDMVKVNNREWEKTLDNLALILQVDEKKLFSMIKLHNNSIERIMKKIQMNKEFRSSFDCLELSQQAFIEKQLDDYFVKLDKIRKNTLLLQELIDDIIFNLFDLDENEIREIRENYVLRSNI
ncbi:MAG: Eco57I restriction-modification methylase domain-containing protein [Candidatus Hodarchaeales archaeon]